MAERKTAKRKRPGPGRLSAEQIEALPDRILDAALAQFSEHGFASTTMDQIARAAGASTKTLYSRYANKVDVLQAVVRRTVDRTLETHEREQPLEVGSVSPRAYLASFGVTTCIRISTEASGLNRFAISEAHQVPDLARFYRASQTHGMAHIRRGLQKWKDEGLLPALSAADMDRAAALCLTMMTDWCRVRTSLNDTPSRKEIETQVSYAVDFFLRGCGLKK